MLRHLTIAFVFALCCNVARADVMDIVTLDTAPLVGDPAGPFSVVLTFVDGSGVGDANNTVTLSDFVFGGGGAQGSPGTFGGVTGSLQSGISMTDSSFINYFTQQFTPGPDLQFSLASTTNSDAGGIPDRLTLFIVDSSGTPLPTLAPFADYFLGLDLQSTGPVFDTWGSDPSQTPSAGGNPISIPAPTVSPVVPEPSEILPLTGILMVLGIARYKSVFR